MHSIMARLLATRNVGQAKDPALASRRHQQPAQPPRLPAKSAAGHEQAGELDAAVIAEQTVALAPGLGRAHAGRGCSLLKPRHQNAAQSSTVRARSRTDAGMACNGRPLDVAAGYGNIANFGSRPVAIVAWARKMELSPFSPPHFPQCWITRAPCAAGR